MPNSAKPVNTKNKTVSIFRMKLKIETVHGADANRLANFSFGVGSTNRVSPED